MIKTAIEFDAIRNSLVSFWGKHLVLDINLKTGPKVPTDMFRYYPLGEDGVVELIEGANLQGDESNIVNDVVGSRSSYAADKYMMTDIPAVQDGTIREFSFWAKRYIEFPHYGFLFGDAVHTFSSSGYGWFIDIHNSTRIAHVSSGIYNISNFEQWNHFVLKIDTINRKVSLTINGLDSIEVTGYISKFFEHRNTNIQLFGFRGFVSDYARPAWLSDLKVFNRELTREERFGLFVDGAEKHGVNIGPIFYGFYSDLTDIDDGGLLVSRYEFNDYSDSQHRFDITSHQNCKLENGELVSETPLNQYPTSYAEIQSNIFNNLEEFTIVIEAYIPEDCEKSEIAGNYNCGYQVFFGIGVVDGKVYASYWNRSYEESVTSLSDDLICGGYNTIVFSVSKHTHTIKLKVNNGDIKSFSNPAIFGDISQPFRLLGWYANCSHANTNIFNGRIREFRVYSGFIREDYVDEIIN